MNGQTRSKSRLLARASTVAILAAAGQFGVVTQAQAACQSISTPTTIGSNIECAEVIGATVAGNVTNNATIGEPVDENTAAAFFVGGEGSITGALINNNTITGGDPFYGALTIGDGGSILGGIVNNSQIISGAGNAISIGYYTSDGGTSSGLLSGGTTNSGGINGAIYGVVAVEGSASGGLLNNSNAVIAGGDVGIFIADTFDSWADGIVNNGNVIGDEAGIQVGSLTGTGVGDVAFSGGIQNSGTISSLNGPSVIAGGNTFGGGITNFGLITQRGSGGEGAYDGVGIVVSAETFNGDITNYNLIEGRDGPAIWLTSENTTFNGTITNNSLVQSSGFFDGTGILIQSSAFNGNVVNNGVISAGTFAAGIVIAPGEFHGNFTNTDRIFGGKSGGLIISSDIIDGGGDAAAEIFNNNLIRGGTRGVRISGGDVVANFTNQQETYLFALDAVIEATSGVGLEIVADSWTGDITNSGRITGSAGDFASGTGIYISTSSFSGNISNSGLIEGGAHGLEVYIASTSSECYEGCGGSFSGSITNNGTIIGSSTGLAIEAGGFSIDESTFTGNLTNGGWIDGGAIGAVIDVGTFTGNIINDGTITGGNTGLSVSLGELDGNFTNNGTIHGFTDGVNIVATTITGDISNNGTIIGEGTDTALYVSAVSMTGNVVNTNYLSASSNALHVNIGTLTGQVINSGHVQSTFGGTAVLLNIGNGTTFQNTGGGFIEGDVEFNDPVAGVGSSYLFSAGNGSIDGSLLGVVDPNTSLNNDTISVTGVHSFVGGTATNFGSFTVTSGTAIMGANSVGGPSASPYAFSNVDTLSVTGGTLYIDQGTTLNVDQSYTQGANGTLMFDLGAPGGSGFSSLTGTQIAGPGDYGQIIVAGPVTLNGTIAGWLDPAFASANPALEEVIYNDVITSTSPITTDFTTTALVANNSLFQLFDLIDGNTVDLRVARSPLGQFPSVSVIVGTNDPFDANIADRTNGIGSGGCGLAGGGWCFNRFAANEPGATQVMTDASPGEDPFAWLRTGVRRVGETAVWGRGVGVWGDTDGDAAVGIPGSDFSLAGGIAGVDHVFTTTLLAGLAAQWTTTDVDFDGRRDNADVSSFEVGAYGSWGDTRLYLNANVSYIWHDFEVRRFDGPDFARGEYDGNTLSAYAEAGKIFETESGFRIQPILAVSYAQLDTDAYSEVGTAATLLNVFDADYSSLKGMVGGRFAYPFELGSGRKWVPEARLVWSHEFMDDQASHFVDVQGGPVIKTLVNGEEFSRDSLVAGAGVTAPVSDDATVFMDYDATLNDDVTIHTVSAGARLRW